MLKSSLILVLKKHGIGNSKNTPRRIVYTVRPDVVASGLGPEISTRKMGGSMGNAVAAKQRSAVSVVENGMGRKTAPKTRKQIAFLKRQSRRDGSVVIVARQWSN